MRIKSGLTAFMTAGALAVTGTLVPISPALATEQGVQATGQAECAAADNSEVSEMTQVSGSEAGDLTAAVVKKLKSGEFASHAASSALNADKAKVYTIESEGDEFTSVTIPAEGEYAVTSNFTVILASHGDVVDYSETLLTDVDGFYHLAQYQNGKQVKNEDTGVAVLTEAEFNKAAAGDPGTAVPAGAGKTAACVATVLGVSGGVAAVIVSVCAGSCAGVATGVGAAVCAACIGAYATVGGASITTVGNCFK